MKAIYEEAKRPFTLDDLKKTPIFKRLNDYQKEILLTKPVREIFLQFEARFEDHPEVIETFIETARRYMSPFPEFEINFKYGRADLYFGTKLIEMKCYSGMTMEDLVRARNQVLSYACLSRFVANASECGNSIQIDSIEVVNALTGDFWTWDCAQFFRSGEADRFYWSIIYPFIANNSLTESEIVEIKAMYNQNFSGIETLTRVIYQKEHATVLRLRRKIYALESQIKTEIKARRNVIEKFVGLPILIPTEDDPLNDDDFDFKIFDY
jgi:hypothetical protein